MIICIANHVPILRHGYPTGKTDLICSHGVDSETLKTVVLPEESTASLGAVFNQELSEWALE